MNFFKNIKEYFKYSTPPIDSKTQARIASKGLLFVTFNFLIFLIVSVVVKTTVVITSPILPGVVLNKYIIFWGGFFVSGSLYVLSQKISILGYITPFLITIQAMIGKFVLRTFGFVDTLVANKILNVVAYYSNEDKITYLKLVYSKYIKTIGFSENEIMQVVEASSRISDIDVNFRNLMKIKIDIIEYQNSWSYHFLEYSYLAAKFVVNSIPGIIIGLGATAVFSSCYNWFFPPETTISDLIKVVKTQQEQITELRKIIESHVQNNSGGFSIHTEEILRIEQDIITINQRIVTNGALHAGHQYNINEIGSQIERSQNTLRTMHETMQNHHQRIEIVRVEIQNHRTELNGLGEIVDGAGQAIRVLERPRINPAWRRWFDQVNNPNE